MRILRLAFSFCFFILLSWVSTAQGEFGVRFIANGRVPHDLDSAGKKLSFRFTCQQDMTVVAASVYCAEAFSSPSYLISLQEDKDGNPSGVALAADGFVPHAQSWGTVMLDSTPLFGGKVYHLVLEFDSNRGGIHPVGRIGPSNHASFLCTDILNRLHPNEGTPDLQANTLLFEGGKWRELNQEPLYAIHGSGFKFQGNPYDNPGVRPIHGNGDPKNKAVHVLQGQVLHFRCGFLPQAIVVRLKKQGHPSAPLNFQIMKNEHALHKVTPFFSDLALASDKAPTDWQWVTIGFKPGKISSLAPECWYIVFDTDSGRASKAPPGCEDCYLISDLGNSGGLSEAADLTFDSGAHLSRATYSLDGGSPFNWIDEFERDANVVVLGHDCSDSWNRVATPIPAPDPLESLGEETKP
jgi:hypothetical protein